MTENAAKWLARAVGAVAATLAVANTVLVFFGFGALAGPKGNILFTTLAVLGGVLFCSIGLLIAVRAHNLIGWILVFAGICIGLLNFGSTYPAVALGTHPGSLPAPKIVAALLQPMWIFVFTSLGLMLLLFPDGAPPSRRWRPVLWLGFAAAAVSYLGVALNPVPVNPFQQITFANPIGIQSMAGVISTILVGTAWVTILAVVASLAGLIVRFRGGNAELRHQVRWLAFTATGACACILVTLGSLLACRCDNTAIGSVMFVLFFLIVVFGVPSSIAIAIFRYRLYDIDVIVNKAVLFAMLAAFFTAVYVAIVIGLGTVIGNRGNSVLTVAAAVLIAVAFQPVRERARHLANRMVYGKRATPYEVLSDFAERMAGTFSSADVLPRMAKILVDGTGALAGRVWLRFGSELRETASWPANGGMPPVTLSPDHPVEFTGEYAVEVRHQGELLGALSVAMPVSDPMNPAKAKLVRDFAGQVGLVLQNVRLIEDLRASRRRIVAAQDMRAKALERNIHDGAQQQLVALAVKQRLAESLIDRDPAKAKSMLAEIQADTTEALETLRDLARGIYPPLLADKGLEVALKSQTRKAPMPVTVESGGLGRYGPEIEAAVYFCCLEALQNVAKYANASSVRITLRSSDDRMSFEVTDDGGGFDTSSTSYGTGLQGMGDRLASLDGTLEVRSSIGAGTVVVGSIPLQ